MTKEDQEFCLRMAEFSNAIAYRINQSSAQGKALKASEILHRRMTNSCNSIMVLAAQSPHDCRVDVGTLLRAIYDAMLQCQYMLKDPALQETRAGLYLDFQVVEQVQFIKVFDANRSDLASILRNSPRRAGNEPKIMAEFNRVSPKFTNQQGRIRRNWYVGTLRDLARDVGYEDEYELMQRELSALTHTSPLASDSPNPGPGLSRVVTHAWLLNLRTLRAIAGLAGVALTAEEEEFLVDCAKSLMNRE